jgi:N-acetylmuramic acid 6-phosphate etherase
MDKNLRDLTTEMRNAKTKEIDKMSTLEILQIINDEDHRVAAAVREVLPQIEKAVEVAYQSIKNGGRLLYVGAGTSGRIGIIDAAECPPTFSVPSDIVQAVMAGGDQAFLVAVEGAEDDFEQGARDLENRHLTSLDTVVGIAASGRTPYVIGALQYAKQMNASTISLSNNKNSLISQYADINIEAVVGPEVLTGSTRMKAATAQKMILNMISSTTMIKCGKVYENLMVDLQISNKKLKERAISIIQNVTGVSYEKASKVLEVANNEVKVAIVMLEANVGYEQAKTMLQKADGFVRKAIELGSTSV